MRWHGGHTTTGDRGPDTHAEGAQEQGSIRQVEEYRVHPNVLKTLKPGEAVVLYRSDHSVRRVRVLP